MDQPSKTLLSFAAGVLGTTAVGYIVYKQLQLQTPTSFAAATAPPPPPPQTDVTGCIGNTPIVALDPTKLNVAGCVAHIYAKLEFQNPGGSVKDRVALAMIEDAERKGLITPGVTTLVEATSGNTGIALAMCGASKGYKVVVAMPRLQSMLERYILVRSFGGQVLLSEPELKSQGFLDLAATYAKEHDHCYLTQQFTNPANPRSHYLTTGPEVWAQMNGAVDAVVMGAGTGGTAVGIGQYLKEHNPNCKICVVEPAESRVMQGAVHRIHSIVGIGTGLHVPMLAGLDPGAPYVSGQGRGLVDEFLASDSPDALDCALLLARSHGLLVGPSTGAAVVAALALGQREEMRGKRILVIAPSSGVRYLQHPMFKLLRNEAFEALSEVGGASGAGDARDARDARGASGASGGLGPGEGDVSIADAAATVAATAAAAAKRDLVQRVETCILMLARQLLETSSLSVHDNLIDHGATSLTAMLLLGKLRTSLTGVLEGSEIHGLKLAIIKERLWGSTRDLALGVVGVDINGVDLPCSPFLTANVTIEYCGG